MKTKKAPSTEREGKTPPVRRSRPVKSTFRPIEEKQLEKAWNLAVQFVDESSTEERRQSVLALLSRDDVLTVKVMMWLLRREKQI